MEETNVMTDIVDDSNTTAGETETVQKAQTDRPTVEAGDEPQSKKRRVEEEVTENGVDETSTETAGANEAGENSAQNEQSSTKEAGDEATKEAGDEVTKSDKAEEEEEEKFVEYEESEDELEVLTEESVKKLLKGVSHSTLVRLAEDLAMKDLEAPELLELAEKAAKVPGNNKVFVRALPFDIKEQSMKKGFNQFGKVTEAIIIKDRQTNRSKGFGFVTYSKAKYAARAIAAATVKIGTREVQCSLAHPKGSERGPPQRSYNRSYGGYGGRYPY